MSDQPNFIDNIDGNTMSAALQRLLRNSVGDATIVTDTSTPVEEARIATAYFSP